MRRKLLIVADDLTGAGDTGVQFSRAGLTVKVIIGVEHLEEEIEGCDVLVVDLESRMDEREEAYRKHFSLGSRLLEMGDFLVYKKLDSTFRGNIGAEIDGLMDALGLQTTLLAPALPASGRTVEGGEVYVRGIKLADTEAAVDPRTPVSSSSIAEIIGLQSRKGCRVVSTGVFVGGVEGACGRVSSEMLAGQGVLVFDSLEERDLENIAEMVMRLGERPFLVAGSSGLARHLGRVGFGGSRSAEGTDREAGGTRGLVVEEGETGESVGEVGVADGVVFIFAGSVSERSQAQVRYALAGGDCALVYLGGERLFSDEDVMTVVESVKNGLEKGYRRFIFTAALTRGDVVEDAERVAAGIGRLAAMLINTFHPYGLLLTGGETAIHTVRCLGATGIRVVDEVLPGIQYGYLVGPVRCLVVTKAGGFGEEDAISKILEFFNA